MQPDGVEVGAVVSANHSVHCFGDLMSGWHSKVVATLSILDRVMRWLFSLASDRSAKSALYLATISGHIPGGRKASARFEVFS